MSTDYLLKGVEPVIGPIETDSKQNSGNRIFRRMVDILLFIAGISAVAVLFLFSLAFLLKTFLGGH